MASSGSPTLVQQTERLDSSTPVLTTVNSSLVLLPDAHSPAAQGFATCPVSQTGGLSHPSRTGGPFSSSQTGGPSSDPLTAGPMMHSEREALLNDECPDNLKEVLPPEKYTYIIEEYESCPKTHDTPKFEATIRINITNKAQADQWLQEFMCHSKCTYRITKTTNPTLKRVVTKYTMHCQHYRKPSSAKQMEAHLHAHTTEKKKPLTSGIRDKKTYCPTQLILTVQVPTKKQLLSSDSTPHLLSHRPVLKLHFFHNHLIHSAHSLSFQPVSDSTREKILTLFSKGHGAASARHAYETELMLQCAEDGKEVQRVLADCSINPTVQDYSRFHAKWRETEMGSENGTDMFSQLQSEIDSYNKSDGKAKLQIYESTSVNMSSDDDNDELKSPSRKKMKLKRKSKTQPLILAICTPLMHRAHQYLRQAGEMVFCDATSSLDRFNTSTFIISTSTPTSGIPLGVIIASDEQESTVHRGLELLREVLPKEAFNGKGVEHGPSIVVTDDSSMERAAIHSFWPDAILLLCTFHFLQ